MVFLRWGPELTRRPGDCAILHYPTTDSLNGTAAHVQRGFKTVVRKP